MPLGTNDVTTTTLDAWAPNVWASEVLRARESRLVLVPLVKHYDRDIKSYGQTVEIPNMSNLTANAKSANTQVTLNAPTETKTTITINQYWEVSALIEDNADAQSRYDTINEYRLKCGYGIAEKMDSFVANAMADNFTQEVGAYGTTINDTNFRLAVRTLDDAKAPEMDRYFVVTPQGKQELLGVDKFVRYDAIGIGGSDNAIKNGRVGTIYDVEVYMSQNLKVTAGTPTQNNSLFFQREAYAIAIQMAPKFERQRKTEYLADLVVCSALWGGSVLRDDHGVVFKH